mgnify:CR=1 FL=1
MKFPKNFYKEHAEQFAAGLALCSKLEEENVMLRVIDSFMVVSVRYDSKFYAKKFLETICEDLDCPIQRSRVMEGR